MRSIKILILYLAINFGALVIGGLFTGSGISSSWYLNLNQAPWTPPGWVFGFAWSLIMVCYSMYLAQKNTLQKFTRGEWGWYLISWGLNILWNPVFFYFHLTWVGLILLMALLAVILRELYFALKQNLVRRFLLWPYILWLLVAFSLNLYICIMNG